MKKIIISLILIVILGEPMTADLNDFFFTPLRRRLIFVEDYYKLYRKNLYGDTAAHLANIYYLKLALKAAETNHWWIHPTQSFAYVRYDWANPPLNRSDAPPYRNDDPPYTEYHHAKYKELMKMRISLLITKSYLKIGSRYDRANIYWFNAEDYENLPYIKKKKQEHYLKRSFRIAKSSYQEAQKYWDKTKHYVRICWEGKYQNPHEKKTVLFRSIDLQGVEMDQMEDEVYKIYHGGNLDRASTNPELKTKATTQTYGNQTRSYQQAVKRYKEQVRDYYNKQNFPEFNYDKVIHEKLVALKLKEARLDEYIARLPKRK